MFFFLGALKYISNSPSHLLSMPLFQTREKAYKRWSICLFSVSLVIRVMVSWTQALLTQVDSRAANHKACFGGMEMWMCKLHKGWPQVFCGKFRSWTRKRGQGANHEVITLGSTFELSSRIRCSYEAMIPFHKNKETDDQQLYFFSFCW